MRQYTDGHNTGGHKDVVGIRVGQHPPRWPLRRARPRQRSPRRGSKLGRLVDQRAPLPLAPLTSNIGRSGTKWVDSTGWPSSSRYSSTAASSGRKNARATGPSHVKM
eukprot:scaffold30597_cov28-Tisochrysis_lutea.AAC.2